MLDANRERATRERFGPLADAPWYHLSVQDPGGALGYRLTLVGPLVAPETLPPAAPRLTLFGGAPTHVLLAVQRCLTHATRPLWLEAWWHPGMGETLALRGLEHRHTKSDVEAVWRGLPLLRDLNTLGRPLQTTTLTQDEFLAKFPAAYRTAQQRWSPLPRQEEVAAQMALSLATFKRYRQAWLPRRNWRP